MEIRRRERGLGKRMTDSARGLMGDIMGGGGGLEDELRKLSLSVASKDGQARTTPGRGLQAMDVSTTRWRGLDADIRSRPDVTAEDDFRKFLIGRRPFEGPNTRDGNVLEGLARDNLFVEDEVEQQSQHQPHGQYAEASTHALPTELKALALDRLRQLEGHLATGEAAKQTQRKAELENEWLLWWDESPTACFDDSKDYFTNDAQRSYCEAWEKHLEHASIEHNRGCPQAYSLDVVPRLREASSPPKLRTESTVPEQMSSGCPSRESHEDLTACGRSTPIAAQHRPCPHAGCGYCSTTSTAWFEHMRACDV